jgi:two-component system chemotaxis response regulator CheB
VTRAAVAARGSSPKPRDPGASAHSAPARLMIVDDSAVARSVLARMLAKHDEFEIVASAATAAEAVALLKQAAVDIVLLDLEMPGGSGLAALPDIRRHGKGARVLVVSSAAEAGSDAAAEAMRLGAADTLAKPGAGQLADLFSQILVERLRLLLDPESANRPEPAAAFESPLAAPGAIGCIAVGASTGGLHSISRFLRALPPRLGVPLLVTQHLPTTFLPLFARQIELASGRPARIAEEGRALQGDEIAIAPGDAHLGLVRDKDAVRVRLSREKQASGCMPSVDVMLAALAETYGAGGLAVVLSGMGRDGLAGSRVLAAAGGSILVQDRASAAVWGMPGAIGRAGLARLVAGPEALAGAIDSWLEPRP